MSQLIRWLPFVFAFLWLVIRYLTGHFFVEYSYSEGRTIGVLSNLFFILILVFVGLVANYNTREKRTFLQDVKDGLKVAMKYVLSAVVMMGLYYGAISDELEVQRQTSFIEIHEALDTDSELASIQEQNPLLAHQGREEIEKEMQERITFFTSLKVLLPASLIALSLTTVFYGLLGVFIWRRFIRAQ